MARSSPTRECLPDVPGWVREHRSQRCFPYLQLVEAHLPYDALPESLDRFTDPELRDTVPAPGAHAAKWIQQVRESGTRPDPATVFGAEGMAHLTQRYDACVATFGAHAGQVLDELEALGLTEATLVVVTADHGEEPFERGSLGHGFSVLDEQTHAPLILAGPGVPRGARQTEPVGNRHLALVLAARVGAPLHDSDAGALGPVFLETHHGVARGRRPPTFSVVDGPWLLSWMPNELAAGRGGLELSALDRDPGATDRPRRARRGAHRRAARAPPRSTGRGPSPPPRPGSGPGRGADRDARARGLQRAPLGRGPTGKG